MIRLVLMFAAIATAGLMTTVATGPSVQQASAPMMRAFA